MSRAKRFLSPVEFPEISEFPVNPSPGRTVFVNGVLYIYANLGGFATWFPINRPQSSYVHSQGSPALVWRVYHGMGSSQVIVAVYDSANNILDASVQHIEEQNGTWYTEITLTTAESGYAVVFGTENLSAPIVNAHNIEVVESVTIAGNPVVVDDDVAIALEEMATEFNGYAAN